MGRNAIQKGRETYEPREAGRRGMSKRKSSDESRGDCAAKRPAQQRKQHLYLLLDDWERGYSIRKLDVDAFDFDSDADVGTDPPPKHFTEPPVARMEALHETSSNFVSHGTKIFAMQPGDAKAAIPAFDTHTLCLAMCPWPSCQGGYYSNPFLASVAGKIFLFTNVLAACLGDPPPYDSKEPWSWTTITARPPFYTNKVICHALHPDGRTLFVSAGTRDDTSSRYRRWSRNHHRSEEEEGHGTFSFDAERLEWTRHGDWLLPFTGPAYFDAELESWVGLCGERGSERDGAGRLCSCDVIAPGAAELTAAPSWKLGEDRMFRKGPQLHLGTKLLHMGDSRFCLVELLFHKDDDHLFVGHPMADVDARHPQPRRRVLRMTTFGLKYNNKGELRTTLRRARARKMYKRPHDFGWLLEQEPLAFWL